MKLTKHDSEGPGRLSDSSWICRQYCSLHTGSTYFRIWHLEPIFDCKELNFQYIHHDHQVSIQGFFQIFHSNSLWIMRHFKFSNEYFVDFLLSYRFYFLGTTNFRWKSSSCSKKPQLAANFFQYNDKTHHREALGANLDAVNSY